MGAFDHIDPCLSDEPPLTALGRLFTSPTRSNSRMLSHERSVTRAFRSQILLPLAWTCRACATHSQNVSLSETGGFFVSPVNDLRYTSTEANHEHFSDPQPLLRGWWHCLFWSDARPHPPSLARR